MEKVTDGVYRFGGYVSAYLIDGDQGVTLIDTGLPGKFGAVSAALGEIGRTATDIESIIITHGHADHFGSAAVVKRESDAPLFASATDAPILRGDRPPPTPPFMDRVPFLKPLMRLMPAPDAVAVDHELAPGAPSPLAGDLSIVETPGHTDGHVSVLLDRNDGVLFVGDAATATKNGEVQRGWMNRRSESFDSSLRRIAENSFAVACFGHSNPIVSGASGAFQRFVATI